MAHFYGNIQGNRGQASRLGTKSSGLRTYTASWQGAVVVTLYENNGVDWATIELAPHNGTGSHCTIFHGPVGGTDHD